MSTKRRTIKRSEYEREALALYQEAARDFPDRVSDVHKTRLGHADLMWLTERLQPIADRVLVDLRTAVAGRGSKVTDSALGDVAEAYVRIESLYSRLTHFMLRHMHSVEED